MLLSIGVLDTATRMGYLLFLPFLIRARGGSSATVGLGLALLFLGGALGKASSGWLGQRRGRGRGRSCNRNRDSRADRSRMFHANHRDAGGPPASRHGPERHVVSSVWHSS